MTRLTESLRCAYWPFLAASAAFILLTGCANTVTVEIPPRVDLKEWPVIGVIKFNAEQHNELAQDATQKFIMHLQNAQPGVRVLELGSKAELLQAMKRSELNPETIKAIGVQYGVQAVLSGRLQVTEGKPDVKFSPDLSSASASTSINGSLDAKLQETSTGASVWSNGAHGKWSIGGVTLSSGMGISNVGYTDPQEKYEEMLRDLAKVATDDFRPRYERRKAK